MEQGKVVSSKLVEYLHKHPEMDEKCSKGGTIKYYTTEAVEVFNRNAATFIGRTIESEKLILK
jgi:glutamate racemase